MAGFERLHPVVQHHVVNTLGWSELRPLQDAAVGPLVDGRDALLLAPTAGGKTEAALFPLLTRMAEQDWRGTSLLYVAPLRALLNNLEPRVRTYATWLGRTSGVRHGDTGQGARRRQITERVDVLLTTPESLESMLVSATIDPHVVLADVQAVVVDEVHAFAGDDRGWHLLAVLERLTRIAGGPLQRVGLSATVGNAEELLTWLQASNATVRPGQVMAPASGGSGRGAVGPDLELDYVGSLENAATVVSALHLGEKRLVFADSRRMVERLASRLTGLGTDTYVSHSSLSAAERRRSEQAFAEGGDCVIVATSTLELGIDVGDLDRVLQIGAPGTVASLLQRLGRTGRRPGSRRNLLLLATDDDQLLRAAGLLLLWSEGFVEPVVPPLAPNHLTGQQLLALCLQEGRVGRNTWPEWLRQLPLSTAADAERIADWLLESGHLDSDTEMLLIGAETERRYGRRHFMDVMSVFTSDPQFVVYSGRDELGWVDPLVIVKKVVGPRLLSLGGRTWQVVEVDWTRHRVHVTAAEGRGLAEWSSGAPALSYQLVDAMRRVLLGVDPDGVRLTSRATTQLSVCREKLAWLVDADRTVISHDETGSRWWTWAGARANAVLYAALKEFTEGVLDPIGTFDNFRIELRSATPASAVQTALRLARERYGPVLSGLQPDVDPRAVEGLKFADLLPPDLALATLAARLGDPRAASAIAARELVERRGT
jgi:ATP-dependent Lhr-like helicase